MVCGIDYQVFNRKGSAELDFRSFYNFIVLFSVLVACGDRLTLNSEFKF